jgi:hypothetical protein
MLHQIFMLILLRTPAGRLIEVREDTVLRRVQQGCTYARSRMPMPHLRNVLDERKDREVVVNMVEESSASKLIW